LVACGKYPAALTAATPPATSMPSTNNPAIFAGKDGYKSFRKKNKKLTNEQVKRYKELINLMKDKK
jgi:hypothetical protein